MDRLTRHPMMRDIPFETAVEHTVDFLELMGTPGLYEEKTAIVEVENWRGTLPCDFKDMIQVRVAPEQLVGKKVFAAPAYRYSGDSFHMSNSKVPDSGLTYKIQGMVIFTSTRNTDVEIAYHAFATDDEGYPVLPDNASFLRGLENYIKMKWMEIKFDMGEVSQAVMERADREYCWAAGDAYSEFSRLDIDKAETLFNSFATLLPRNNEHWKGFFTNGSKEIWRGGQSGINPFMANVKDQKVKKKETFPEFNPIPKPEPEPGPGPEPTPTQLDFPVYFGGQNTELPLDSYTSSVVGGWNKSSSYTTTGIDCNQIWYYIALHANYEIVSIITDNTEPIKDLFELKGRYNQDGKTYNLYEFHLSSDLPLDVKMTLVVK